MIKLLIFECARAKKIIIGEVSCDCKAYFDGGKIAVKHILTKT